MSYSRNTPEPITPHNRGERKVAGLRDSVPPPETYVLKKLLPDGTIIRIGEFPTPKTFPLMKGAHTV